MRRFTIEEIATIKHMASAGHSGISIARQLSRPALAIRHKVCELGIQLRPPRIESKKRIVIGAEVLAMLKQAATARGVSPMALANRLLSICAVDRIVDAVLDDVSTTKLKAAGRAKAKAKAKTVTTNPPTLPTDISIMLDVPLVLRGTISMPELFGSANLNLQTTSARSTPCEV